MTFLSPSSVIVGVSFTKPYIGRRVFRLRPYAFGLACRKCTVHPANSKREPTYSRSRQADTAPFSTSTPTSCFISLSSMLILPLSQRRDLRFIKMGLAPDEEGCVDRLVRSVRACVTGLSKVSLQCRVHPLLSVYKPVTPAMKSGITDHVWSLGELLTP
jgi:hypothetical protein